MVKTKLTKTIPPKSGPNSQGLKIESKKTKVVRLEEKNGLQRQNTKNSRR
jgi:hypothetical protein